MVGPLRVSLSGMEWRVGVLRPVAENVAWTHRGDAPDWETARLDVIDALRILAADEGRQECRVWIDGQDGTVAPALDAEGRVMLADLDRALPVSRYWS